MGTYITDTHALLWAFTRPGKLGAQARQAYTDVGNGDSTLLVPVIVLAELIFTIENKPIQADFDVILKDLSASPNIEFVDLDFQSTLKLRELTAIPEMHDRIIVASAIKYGASLITYDGTITKSGLIEVIW
jgi:PIN domain nuclease of toxin-antitoxin system